MKATLITISVIGIGLFLATAAYSRLGYESPDYEVVKKDGKFEVRNYPSMTIISTAMDGPDPNDGSSFMRLFRYISKGNEAEEKISMTTPVFRLPADNAQGQKMSFVAPTKNAEAGMPAPNSDAVKVEKLEGGRFAAVRFSGRWENELSARKTAALKEWIEEQGLKTVGKPIHANYDPPFTPPMLRRNEVLFRLAN